MNQSNSLTFLPLPVAMKRMKMTANQYEKVRKCGYIGAVKGPVIAYYGRYPRVTAEQCDKYLLRTVAWRTSYLNGPRTAEFLNMPDTNKTRSNYYISKVMRTEGIYMGIRAPLPYRFEGQTDLYWHIKDLELFTQFIRAVGNCSINRASPTYNAKTDLFEPNYVMPAEEEYMERYTEGTLILLEKRKTLPVEDLDRWRRYRKGYAPGRKVSGETA